jgi:hypothetical protein
MNDVDIIQAAYADVLARLFSVYFDALVMAAGDPAMQAKAANAFQSGLILARKARDAAAAAVTRPGASG